MIAFIIFMIFCLIFTVFWLIEFKSEKWTKIQVASFSLFAVIGIFYIAFTH
jgi:hypothetical protein